MISLMDKNTIINLVLRGNSFREVQRQTGIDRKTISSYWKEYKVLQENLEKTDDPILKADLQERISSKRKYNSDNRTKRKLNTQFYKDLNTILEEEKRKRRLLGPNKQALTVKQIHKQLKECGHTVAYITVAKEIQRIKASNKECYIRQEYDFGDRLEYDFGEVKLIINKKRRKYFMAVFCSPASNFRWCYIYEDSKMGTFLDSQVRFFEMVGGVWDEVVYDNMRNVVSKFLGKSEKLLNPQLLSLSTYYGFSINVTNAFSGNEKGSVERSVEVLRNEIFAEKYEFPSIEAAIKYANKRLQELNKESKIEQEKLLLRPAKPPLELAEIRKSKVSKYGFIKVDHHFYSVPDYLVDQEVTTKLYSKRVIIYSRNEFICEHQRLYGNDKPISADIRHYLRTLSKKPRALKNSVVLKSNPDLKLIFDQYFSSEPKRFIMLVKEYQSLSDDDLVKVLRKTAKSTKSQKDKNTPWSHLIHYQAGLYNKMMVGGDK